MLRFRFHGANAEPAFAVKLMLQDLQIQKSACIEANVVNAGKVNCLFCESIANFPLLDYNTFS